MNKMKKGKFLQPFECHLNETKILSKKNRQKTLLLSLSNNKFIQSHSIYMINFIYLGQRVPIQSDCGYNGLNIYLKTIHVHVFEGEPPGCANEPLQQNHEGRLGIPFLTIVHLWFILKVNGLP